VPAGEILLADSPNGARMLVDLHRLPPGSYRLSIHLGGDCGPGPDDTGAMAAGVLAGDLWTPADGVGEAGMASDQPPPDAGTSTTPPILPPLEVGDDGRAAAEFIVPEITDANQLWHRSLVMHGKNDARVACGLVD
jgi:Cu/Zn superoxide dismutase